jgi:ferrous iron transport protein A
VVALLNSGKTISALKRGAVGFINKFTDDEVAQKLMSMGILPGTRIELVRKAPLGGGCYVKADNLLIALRSEEAARVILR